MATRTRKPTTERRAEIARAALDVVGTEGPTAFTTQRLADAVGVSTGALFRHFATLDEVLEEAVRLAVLEVEATFPDPDLAPTERLFALVRGRVALLRREPGIAWLLRSEQALFALPSSAVKRLEALIGRSRRFLAEALDDGIAEGEIRDDVPVGALLVIVTGTVHALVGMSGVHGRATKDQKRAVDQVADVLKTLIQPPRRRKRR
jgi:AcrR family transcriptional regulator